MSFRHATMGSLAVGLSALGIVLGPGCGGDDGIGKRYPVSGKVTFEGKPLEQGTIGFLPLDEQGNGRPASGMIVGGEYAISTMGDRDGALPGKYQVTIVAKDMDESKLVVPKYGGQPTPESRRKAARASKSLIPAKYGRPTTSQLTYEVTAASSDANFDLRR